MLHQEGWSIRQIDDRFGVSHTSISSMVEDYRESGELVETAGQSIHFVKICGQDRYLRLWVLRQRFVTERIIQSQLQKCILH